MRVIVQKYGGTSIASNEAREKASLRIREAVQAGMAVVVVVSAMGRLGEPYSTDTLQSLAKDIWSDTSPRNLDLLMACGETISSVIMSSTLARDGLNNAVLTAAQAGITTNDDFGHAEIIRVETHMLVDHLAQGKVVIVPGFQGTTQTLDVTTLGRGGSDTTAVVLGAALKAEFVEIFTDVDGVKTADPKIVPDARTIEAMTFDEISHMAGEGAEVIGMRAVEIAMKHNVPVKVRSTFDDSPGTLITVSGGTDSWSGARGAVAGITHVTGLHRFLVRSDPGMHPAIFRRLAERSISVDMVSMMPDRFSFVVKEHLAQRALAELKAMGVGDRLSSTKGCVKLSVVGSGMRGMPGVMADLVEALSIAQVEVFHAVDSLTTISCLIDKAELEVAAQALHERFALGNPHKRNPK